MNGERKPFPVLQSEFDEIDGAFHPTASGWPMSRTRLGAIRFMFGRSSGCRDRRQRAALEQKRARIVPWWNQPRWRADGKELFYVSLDHKIVSVSIKTGPPFEPGGATPLFDLPSANELAGYDVTPDGKRFLITTPSDEHGPRR